MLRDSSLSLWVFSVDAFEIFQSCDAVLWYNPFLAFDSLFVPSEVVWNSLQPKEKRKKEKETYQMECFEEFWKEGNYKFVYWDCSAVHTHLFVEHQYLIIWLCCEVHLRAQLHPVYLTSLLRCACCWPFLAVLCPELWSCFWLVIDIKKIECVIRPDVTLCGFL